MRRVRLSEPAPRFPLIAWLERRSRGQVVLAIVLVVLYLLLSAVRGLASVQLDRWWLDSVTDAPVWRTIMGAKALLVVVAAAVTLLVLGGSIWRVLRTTRVEDGPPPARPLLRYQQRVGPAHGWVLIAVAVLVTWNVAAAAAGEWPSWLLFLHGGEIPTSLPGLEGDLTYHLFSLPLVTTVTAWLRDLLLVTLLVTTLGYIGTGALRLPRGERRSAPGVVLHLAVLGALFALVQAGRHVLVDRPNLATDRTGTFDGAGYAPRTVTSPGLVLLALALVAVAIALVVAARTGRWKPLVAVVGVWLVLALAVPWLAPGAVQRFVVDPDEAGKERPLVEANLAATRHAYGLDRVEKSDRTLGDEQGLDSGDVTDAQLPAFSLFTPEHLVEPLQVLEGTPVTRIEDVDLDRYEVDGERRPVLVAARTASREDLPERGWSQSHLVYTHGNGLVLVPADDTARDGSPDVDALDELLPERQELYFGEGVEGWYAIVGTDRTEQDGAEFDADTGIPIGSSWRQLVFSLANGEVEPLLSDDLTDESQLLYRRGLRERLDAIAPFLEYDSDPYPVVADGRVVWVVDAYTTASTYPFSQFRDTSELSGGDLSHQRFNYVQNSVTATVDAYSGEVHLYRRAAGDDDPVLEVWDETFPGMFEPIDAMPDELREHLRYPADLLAVQAAMLGRYHVETPDELFDGSDRWSVSEPLPDGVSEKVDGTADAVSLFGPDGGPAAGNWISQHTYTPGASGRKSSLRDVLAGYAVADNDDADQLSLVRVESPAGHPVNSPQVVQGLIDADPELARDFTFLDSSGSQVKFGPMTMVPVGDSVAWIRPVVVVGGARTSTPRLYRVLAVVDGSVGEGDDVTAAIADAAAKAADDGGDLSR